MKKNTFDFNFKSKRGNIPNLYIIGAEYIHKILTYQECLYQIRKQLLHNNIETVEDLESIKSKIGYNPTGESEKLFFFRAKHLIQFENLNHLFSLNKITLNGKKINEYNLNNKGIKSLNFSYDPRVNPNQYFDIVAFNVFERLWFSEVERVNIDAVKGFSITNPYRDFDIKTVSIFDLVFTFFEIFYQIMPLDISCDIVYSGKLKTDKTSTKVNTDSKTESVESVKTSDEGTESVKSTDEKTDETVENPMKP